MKLPKGPKLTMPGKSSKGAAGPKKAAAKRPSVEAPPFVQNTYRDLRDRHLLIPAIVLLIALVAVPFALSSSSEPALPAAAPVVPADATAVEPAVLAEQLGGVRDYRKRLDALKQKNPFDQQFLIPTPKSESVEEVSTSTVTDPATTGGSSSGAIDPSVSSTTGGTSTVSTDPAGPATQPPADNEPTTVYIYAPRIDVVIAHNGKRKKYEAVRPGQLLPDRSVPIAMFLTAPNSLEYARFLLSADVTSSDGDGHCAPNANDCEFLKLGLDEKRAVEYGPDAEKYSIMVTDIRRVLVDKTKQSND